MATDRATVFLDHDPWEHPSDPEQDLYSDEDEFDSSTAGVVESGTYVPKGPRTRSNTWNRKLGNVKPNSPIDIVDVDAKLEKAVIRNLTDEVISLDGWHAQNISSGKSCAPFEGITIAPHSNVTLWTAPAMKGSVAPQTDDDENILWRGKGNGKPRRLAVLNNNVGDGIELFDRDQNVMARGIAE
eukprot:m.172569 g.172569  ORF g.172569 m.172569 type:complete len:185 (-) comp31693_c1_seq3:39-593(-)